MAKDHGIFSKLINVGCFTLGMPAICTHPVIQVIDGNKQHVGASRFGSGPNRRVCGQCDKQDETATGTIHRHVPSRRVVV